MFNKSGMLEKIKKPSKKMGCLGALILFFVLLFIIRLPSWVKGNKSETELTTSHYENDTEYTPYENEPEYESEATTETTTGAATKEQTTRASSTSAQTTKVTSNRTGIDPEFKEFWDSYEKFYDTYIYCMSHTDEFSTSEYLAIMSQYADFAEKAEAYNKNDDDLTDEEVKYMAAVQARVTAKLTYASMTT